MRHEVVHLEREVLVIGAGGAGMYAAIEAAKGGAEVLLIDRSLIGRGGATVMAMMTVAVALDQKDAPDDPSFHLADTLTSGQGLCDERLSRLLCEEGPECILEMDAWGVGWARSGSSVAMAHAPGHDRPRCVYVDFLNTGPAVSKTLRKVLHKETNIQRVGDLLVIDLTVRDGAVTGAIAVEISTGRTVRIEAGSTIIATGGLTRLFERSSASFNMGGDGYALALRAGARLIDMEFVQFFPIGHLAPRLIGLDPIMWDPFRYKLGGKLLNGNMEEFTSRYGKPENAGYVITRDAATYAITKEVAAGRGSPSGGVYLSFMHLTDAELKEAFGPVIAKLSANGIDLTKMPIEVSPIAHYHMGGIAVDEHMRTGVPGLYAAGEAVGGANGANRLSGNAVTEALTFGRKAGRSAAADIRDRTSEPEVPTEPDAVRLALVVGRGHSNVNTAAMILELQAAMTADAGPFKTEAGLRRVLNSIDELDLQLGTSPPGQPGVYDPFRIDWFDLRNMLLVARAVVEAALTRTESRGAHQREDYPGMLDQWRRNQYVTMKDGKTKVVQGPLIPTSKTELMT